jgi:CarboxypepD_reg-like domain
MKIWIITLLTLVVSNLSAQTFKGKVINQKTNEALLYSNIGVKGKSIGGIADDKGDFSIDISKASPNDQIVVSYLGFESKIYSVKDIKLGQNYEVKLEQKSFELEEVVVYNKREKIILGNNKTSFRMTGWGNNESGFGKARGLIIEPKELPLKANWFVIHFKENTFDSVKFRLNLLIPDEKGETFKPLLNENIFFTVTEHDKWIRVDLQKYNIVISQKILVAVELVDVFGKKRASNEDSHLLRISMSKKEGYFYHRETPEEPMNLEFSKVTPSMYFECYGLGK